MNYATWFTPIISKVKRSAGRSSVAAAAYRLAAELRDERTEITHDYTRKRGVEAAFTIVPVDAPDWARDPQNLWNAAEGAERINGVVGRELLLPLPASVSKEIRIAIAEETAAYLVERYGVAASVGVHEPDKHGDARNFHAHILFTTRIVDADGFGAKTRQLDDLKTGPEEITHIREAAARITNAALEETDSEERVSPDSYATRGEDREPTKKLGPAASALERDGITTDRGDENRAIEAANAQHIQLNQLVDELAALDEEIAEEMAQQWEEPADFTAAPSPAEIKEPVPASVSDQVHASPAATFDAVHQETVAQAVEEKATMANENATGWRDAFQRVNAWWQNMREHFVEWRDHLQERIEGYFYTPTPPDPDPSEPDSMEPQP